MECTATKGRAVVARYATASGSAVEIFGPRLGTFGALQDAEQSGASLLAAALVECTDLDAASINALEAADAVGLARAVVGSWPADVPMAAFWRARIGREVSRGLGAVVTTLAALTAIVEPNPDLARVAALAALGDVNKGDDRPATAQKPAIRSRRTIPPSERTIPLSFRRAAKLLGKGGSKDAAEWLSQSVRDGSYDCESVTRQTHVFDRRDFPKSVWPEIMPAV